MSDDMIRVTYRIETAGEVAQMAARTASDQSTDTFTDLPGETAALRNRFAARVESVTPLPAVAAALFPAAR